MTRHDKKATYVDPSGHVKPWKSGPKQFKRGPGPTGGDRLRTRVLKLLVDARRLEMKPDVTVPDAVYAGQLAEALRAFLDLHQHTL